MTDTLPSSPPAAAGALDAPAVVARPEAAGWQVWTGLWIVYIVWGSTYLAIRIMVETVPPLLGAGARFLVAGGLMLAFLAARRGARVLRPGRRELARRADRRTLLPGANAVVSVAEQEVPSSIAALLIASVPLWVILLRRLDRRRRLRPQPRRRARRLRRRGADHAPGRPVGRRDLPRPRHLRGRRRHVGLGLVRLAAADAPARRARLDGLADAARRRADRGRGLVAGEAGDVHPDALSLRSLLALAYLVVFGSWIAFTAYAWLLQNAPSPRSPPTRT